jgi:hypothetical protein
LEGIRPETLLRVINLTTSTFSYQSSIDCTWNVSFCDMSIHCTIHITNSDQYLSICSV